jgi:MFS family permease
MAPQVLATFRAIFSGGERGKAFSVYGGMLGVASAVGLLLGGLLTDANLFGWSWRSVFFVNIPVAACALVAGLRFVPETRDPGARRPNIPGAVLLAGSLVAIVYPLVAFSVGTFIGAPVAVPLAQRHGRRVLAIGGLLMTAGMAGVALAAAHVGVNGSPWPVVPGLVLAGLGLALLVIPLVSVVLAAVPVETAGGASGLFSTAQQLGGALGVALLGTVFFGYLGSHSFEAALVHTAPYAMGAFLLCAVLSMLLPRTAVSEQALSEA